MKGLMTEQLRGQSAPRGAPILVLKCKMKRTTTQTRKGRVSPVEGQLITLMRVVPLRELGIEVKIPTP